MKIVLTLGISRPLSMIVVATRMSNCRRMKLIIVRSSSSPRHLAVGDSDPGLGHDRLNGVGDGGDVVNAVMDEIDLAIAIELAVNGALDDLAVEAADAGFDRLAVGRRGFEIGDIADAEQAHVQRARNRRGRKRQHVDRGAQGFEPLLVFDAESLLLVDDHQPQVLERDVFLQDAVGADQDVDLALGRRASAPRGSRPWAGSD